MITFITIVIDYLIVIQVKTDGWSSHWLNNDLADLTPIYLMAVAISLVKTIFTEETKHTIFTRLTKYMRNPSDSARTSTTMNS